VQADDLTGETEPLNVPGTDRENPNWRRRLARPVGEITGTAAARAVLNAVREGGR
jgi:glycogen operon protein